MQFTSGALNVRFGSLADISECPSDVRFTPESGHWNSVAKCPLCAISGLMQCSNSRMFSRYDEPQSSRKITAGLGAKGLKLLRQLPI
jgi:hypothetical protein